MRRASRNLLLGGAALGAAVTVYVQRDACAPRVATDVSAARSDRTEAPSSTVADPMTPMRVPYVAHDGAAARAEEPSQSETTGDPLAALDDREPFRRIEAAEALARAGRVDALPKLQKIELRQNGYLASTVVRSIARLATMASPEARDGAARYLGAFFSEEVRRRGHDRAALGNVIVAIDALADTGSAEAVPPLVRELDDESLPLPARTKIVEALAALDARAAVPAIERFHHRVSNLPVADDPFEEELRREALAASADALTGISGARR